VDESKETRWREGGGDDPEMSVYSGLDSISKKSGLGSNLLSKREEKGDIGLKAGGT